jgi:hypothetical protein
MKLQIFDNASLFVCVPLEARGKVGWRFKMANDCMAGIQMNVALVEGRFVGRFELMMQLEGETTWNCLEDSPLKTV